MPELPNEGQGTRDSDNQLAKSADDGSGVGLTPEQLQILKEIAVHPAFEHVPQNNSLYANVLLYGGLSKIPDRVWDEMTEALKSR